MTPDLKTVAARNASVLKACADYRVTNRMPARSGDSKFGVPFNEEVCLVVRVSWANVRKLSEDDLSSHIFKLLFEEVKKQPGWWLVA